MRQERGTHNPVKGVKRPRTESGEGRTPALGDHQARDLLAAPGKETEAGEETVKERRDRAILSTLLFHALRRDELCKLKVRDFRHARRGVPHLRVSGKGEKTRYLPLHPGTNTLIHDYLDAAGHGADDNGALFRPIQMGGLHQPASDVFGPREKCLTASINGRIQGVIGRVLTAAIIICDSFGPRQSDPALSCPTSVVSGNSIAECRSKKLGFMSNGFVW